MRSTSQFGQGLPAAVILRNPSEVLGAPSMFARDRLRRTSFLQVLWIDILTNCYRPNHCRMITLQTAGGYGGAVCN
jgi:hypothetical protein